MSYIVRVTDLEFPSGTGNPTSATVGPVFIFWGYRFRIPFRDWKLALGMVSVHQRINVTDLEFPSGTGNTSAHPSASRSS